MSNPQDYTVGWICAIATEYVAAQAFLDEKHDGPQYVSPNDNNDYTLGKIGKHNVVIAVLPGGEYGIASAAGVAKDMLHSFPNVRIGLMVGVGGGAPSPKHDIRLGDIVVSAPRDGKGGVFQYDFGKTIQDQTFQATGFLNQPPTVLRTAMKGLEAQYESDGHQFEEAINTILERKPRLRKKYKRPDASSDRLYQSRFTHPPDAESVCALVCGDDPLTLISRPERTENDDNPSIHYGLIASANQLMKDALVRDRLAAEKDVLCFEMEAAGLMNQFPCLVIRGICDYSDSHKNKEWQGYAAMAAAAYAKDLLYRIPPNRVEAEEKIKELLSDIRDPVLRIETSVKLIESKLDRKEDLEILDWLTPIDYGAQQSDYLRQRQNGTGKWLLNSTKFEAWVQTDGQTLFCPGIPGAGKTIITSMVVDELRTRFSKDQNIGLAYIYCNFRRQDEQKAEDLLSSLLKQLAQEWPFLPDSVQSLYVKHKDKRTRPLFDEISKTLQAVATMYSRVFIIVDALDECRSSDGDRERFLSNIFNFQDKVQANVFATSRPIPEISAKFCGSLSLEIRAIDEDVQTYLASQIYRFPSFVARNLNLQDQIKSTIAKAVGGMFLLAPLHIDAIVNEPTVGHLELALKNLPRRLDETYEQAMMRIESQGGGFRHLAKRVLSWIVHAKRRLSTAELQHALAVEPGMLKLDEKFIPDIEMIASICTGLVTVDTHSDVVRLVHYTTQEYFQRTQKRWFPDAETDITAICVTYLSFDVFESGHCQVDDEFEERLESNKLYDYAAHNWGHHARQATTLGREVIGFLLCDVKVEASSQALMAVKRWPGDSNYSQRVPKQIAGLHLTAYFGIEEGVKALFQKGAEVDANTSKSRTPLSHAAENGHEAIVKLLLDTGEVDADSKDVIGQTPLSLAAEKGHEAVLKLLLNAKKVDVDSKDADNRTPLSHAAENGHEAIVKLLLDTEKVDIDLEDADSRTPLSLAAENGHEAIVKLLLDTGKVDVDLKDDAGQTPLLYAAENGYEAIVKLLLDTGKVDIDSKGSFGQTPLLYAAEKGHEAIVKLLLNTGKVDVDSKGRFSQTPLSYAAEKGHEAIVKLLLNTGKVDVDSKDSGRTPLSYAAEKGHEAIVKLLLNTGKVDVDSKGFGQTPLSYAAEKGHEAIVKLLLDTGKVDVDSKGSFGRTPLSYAAANGHEAVLKLLQAQRGTLLTCQDRAF